MVVARLGEGGGGVDYGNQGWEVVVVGCCGGVGVGCRGGGGVLSFSLTSWLVASSVVAWRLCRGS